MSRLRAICLHRAGLSLLAILWLVTDGGRSLHAGTPAPTLFSDTRRWLIKTWTTEQGLPGTDVTGIVQTPDGYLWLGTFDGLARFDGLTFSVFDRSNTPDLPSNAVVNLHLDGKGVLWISTDRGMVSLKEGRWKVYGAKEGWTAIYARTFAEGSGKLFVTSFEGKVFQFREDRFEELPEPPGQHGAGYIGHVDEQGRLWVVQYRYFGYWDGVRWSETVPSVLSDQPDIMAGSAQDGGIWVYHHRRLEKFRSGEPVERIAIPQALSDLWSLTEDQKGNIWLASYKNGLIHFYPNREDIEWLNATNGLSMSTRCVYEDYEGNVWVGSGGDGLMRLKERPVFAFGEPDGLPKSTVRSIAVGRGDSMYFGCYGGGLFGLNWRTGLRAQRPQTLADKGLIDSVLVDRDGRLWAAQSGVGLLCYDGQQVSTNDILSLPEKHALALFEDSVGRIWLSDTKLVRVFENGRWQVVSQESGLAIDSVRAIAEDRQSGVMWLGAYNGDLYQCVHRTIRRVVPSGDQLRGAIIALLSDADGTLWLGSVGSGLGRLRQGELRWIDQARGLACTQVGSVLDDGLGNLWLSSQNGIARVSRTDLNRVADGQQARVHCRLFDVSDGMPANDCSTFTQPSAARDPYGRLWFATRKGAAVVVPGNQSTDSTPTPVWIETVDYIGPDGKAHHVDRPLPARLTLPAGTKRLQIHYTGLCLSAPEKITFRQRVDNVDRDWVEVGSDRLATFQDPRPGMFQFRVTAANEEGFWNETGASLAYTVLPLFWQTRWFRALMGLLVVVEAALIVGLIGNHYRSSRLRTELHDNQERWDMASVAAKLGLWTWDIHADRFWATDNAYALIGQSSFDPITFRELAEAQHPDDREAAQRALQRALAGERDYDTEFRVMLSDSQPRWLAARGVVDFDKQGKPARLRGVWIDLSARKHLEFEAARHRDELAHMGRVAMLAELSGSLAHEVNQPLAAILSNAQAAQRYLNQTPLNTTELREILVDIVAEDRRAGEVIRRMRSMLKKGPAELQSLDVNKIVQQVLLLAHSDLVARNVSVLTHLAPYLPLVRGDPIQIQQVLLNLILNGCEAMQTAAFSDRQLLLETERDGADQVRISVIDQGEGVSGPMLEKIFEAFVTTKKNGLGMGLSLCRSIITAHGGRIWAARNEGRGLTVSFTLKVSLEPNS